MNKPQRPDAEKTKYEITLFAALLPRPNLLAGFPSGIL